MDNRPLPPGWISQWDQTHQRYFFVNTATGVSSWDDPRNAMPMSAPPPPPPGHQQPYGAQPYGAQPYGQQQPPYGAHPTVHSRTLSSRSRPRQAGLQACWCSSASRQAGGGGVGGHGSSGGHGGAMLGAGLLGGAAVGAGAMRLRFKGGYGGGDFKGSYGSGGGWD
ncbi:hypothetical protein BC831DRAFT_434979 [Entophlyctis helioformis]|nr:hypothetical protein BC831DRAFT_434979 [Entophlyctis helioformis]